MKKNRLAVMIALTLVFMFAFGSVAMAYSFPTTSLVINNYQLISTQTKITATGTSTTVQVTSMSYPAATWKAKITDVNGNTKGTASNIGTGSVSISTNMAYGETAKLYMMNTGLYTSTVVGYWNP